MLPSDTGACLFDLDDTLAESKQPVTEEMAGALARLLERMPVSVISGGTYGILLSNVVARMPEGARLENLYLQPTSGAVLYRYADESWHAVYSESLTDTEADAIVLALTQACEETGLVDLASEAFGERIERRGPQVTLSALGQQAPLQEKLAWDPSRAKRTVLFEAIARRLPMFSVKMGGTTSFDITKPGIDKAYGVRMLSEHISIPIERMLYVGDALFPGGNDEVVKQTGIPTKQVTNPRETIEVIDALIAR